jgi:hypothetical protein
VLEMNLLRQGQRVPILPKADTALHKLRLYLRLAHHWHWLSPGQYQP